MNTGRFAITNAVWERLSPHLPGKATDCGVTATDNRLFLEAILWRGQISQPRFGRPFLARRAAIVFLDCLDRSKYNDRGNELIHATLEVT